MKDNNFLKINNDLDHTLVNFDDAQIIKYQ